jgi:hypothetical protein
MESLKAQIASTASAARSAFGPLESVSSLMFIQPQAAAYHQMFFSVGNFLHVVHPR